MTTEAVNSAVAPGCCASTVAARIVRLSKDEGGGPAIEFGLLAPVLLLFLFGIVEGGRMLWTLNALHYSVQEAARCASINTAACGSASQVQAFAAGRAGAGFDPSVFTSALSGCGNQVSANYTMALNIPFMTHSISLTAQSCYPI
jgi:Flp pilus assembly pilin Flp